MPHRPILTLALVAATGFVATGAHASSGDAWEEFRADVSEKCIAAAPSLDKPVVVVDPFGSESFGLALVSGKPKGAENAVTQICVYDKQKKTVEIGGELAGDTVTVVAPPADK